MERFEREGRFGITRPPFPLLKACLLRVGKDRGVCSGVSWAPLCPWKAKMTGHPRGSLMMPTTDLQTVDQFVSKPFLADTLYHRLISRRGEMKYNSGCQSPYGTLCPCCDLILSPASSPQANKYSDLEESLENPGFLLIMPDYCSRGLLTPWTSASRPSSGGCFLGPSPAPLSPICVKSCVMGKNQGWRCRDSAR